MTSRSPKFILGIALGGCLLLLVCAAVIGLGGYLVATNASLFAGNAAGPTNRIVYLGNDGNLYVADPQTGAKIGLTQDADSGATRTYNYPTWAPDNRRIAFVGLHIAGEKISDASLYTITPAGEKLTELYKTGDQFPFYLYWSPDSRFVAFLASKSQTEIALRVAPGDKENSFEELDSGNPFYWAWSPNGKSMFVHVGGSRSASSDARLGLLYFKQNQPPQSLAPGPGAFQAPQWSPDGKHLLFSMLDSDRRQALAVTNDRGEDPHTLLNHEGRVAFSWSPSGDHIAYIVTEPNQELPHYGRVHVMDVDGQNSHEISNENALAFFWSPNGKRLAYLTVAIPGGSGFAPSTSHTLDRPMEQQQRVEIQWRVLDVDSNNIRTLATFVPTREFISLLPYFDQYALSMTFWSPDSQSFLYSNRETAGTGTLWIADATGNSTPRQLADAVIGFWSWK